MQLAEEGLKREMETTWELYEMVQALLQAPAYHLALEAFLVMWLLWLIFHKSYQPVSTKLTDKEKEELIAEWQPEPLVPKVSLSHHAFRAPVVSGKLGKMIEVNGRKCLNLATHNYLGLVENPELEEVAIKGLRKYGVGSCGPRAFYGTVDIHLDLEAALAKFLGTDEAVLYSHGFASISSAIPAYAKHGDVIFCDEGANFAIQQGLNTSRSRICFFKHNDINDLQRLLEEQAELDRKNPKKAKVTRRFLVVEGLYMNYGDICPLPQLVELTKEHKVRLFIDETCSFGVLGKSGKGVTEHFGVPVYEVDVISASLENSVGSYGGFCCGSSFVVDHQRLSGLGYCFSASLPPLQAAVAMQALKIIETNPGIISKLCKNSKALHNELQRIPQIHVIGEPISPIKHLQLVEEMERDKAVSKLEKVVDQLMEQGVALTVARYLDHGEHLLPPPSIRIIASPLLQESEIVHVVSLLEQAFQKIL